MLKKTIFTHGLPKIWGSFLTKTAILYMNEAMRVC